MLKQELGKSWGAECPRALNYLEVVSFSHYRLKGPQIFGSISLPPQSHPLLFSEEETRAYKL